MDVLADSLKAARDYQMCFYGRKFHKFGDITVKGDPADSPVIWEQKQSPFR